MSKIWSIIHYSIFFLILHTFKSFSNFIREKISSNFKTLCFTTNVFFSSLYLELSIIWSIMSKLWNRLCCSISFFFSIHSLQTSLGFVFLCPRYFLVLIKLESLAKRKIKPINSFETGWSMISRINYGFTN